MKRLVFAFVFFCSAAVAQDDIAFKVITCTDNIKINDVPITPGMNVPMSKSRIKMPWGGSMWVIIPNGALVNVDNNLRVDKVKRRDVSNRLTVTGAIHRSMPLVEFPMAPRDNRNAWMLGDTLFTFWKVYYLPRGKDPILPFTFKVMDMFEEPLVSVMTDKYWAVVNIGEFKKTQTALLYSLQNEGGLGLIKMMKPDEANKKRDEIRLQQKPFVSDNDFEFYSCAIYQINELALDQQYSIYKILSSKKSATDPFLRKYFEWLSNKNEFSNLEF